MDCPKLKAHSMSFLCHKLNLCLLGGRMRKRLAGFGFSLLFVAGLLYGQAAMACTTQTLIVGGKMTVCTICGTVVSCM
jgi:hypothetical protein